MMLLPEKHSFLKWHIAWNVLVLGFNYENTHDFIVEYNNT